MLLWREDARRGRLVTAICEQCQAWGLRLGQPLHEATDLLLRTKVDAGTVSSAGAEPLVMKHDPRADREALDQIASLLQLRISPLVAVEPEPTFAGLTSHQPQTLLLDITGIGQWFGSEQAVLSEAREELKRCGLQARMAIANTSAAAWALARFAREPISLVPDITPGQPDTPVQPCASARAIGVLPTPALRLDERTLHQLDRLGLRTVADVMQLPRDGLAARLGSELLRRIDELMGQVDQVLTMHQATVEERAVCSLEYPTSDREILMHRLRLLVEDVSRRLTSRRRGALRLSCLIEMVQQPPETMDVALFVPTADSDHLARLVLGAMEQHRCPDMVERLTLTVTLGGPLQQYQPTMFDDDSISQVDTKRSLARMIETLAGRLGRSAVVGVELSKDPLPEAAFRLRPLAGELDSPLMRGRQAMRGKQAGVGGRRSVANRKLTDSPLKSPRQSVLPASLGPSVNEPMRRPLKMLTEPSTIEVLAFDAEGVPQQIRVERRTDQVVRYWGPERIETGWWDGPQVRRDYYRVELASGQWWWIFHQLDRVAARVWKLHGVFS